MKADVEVRNIMSNRIEREEKEQYQNIFHLPETHPQMGISHWSMNDYHFPCQPTLHARATYKPRFEKQPCQPSD